jgi:hypothetical protein
MSVISVDAGAKDRGWIWAAGFFVALPVLISLPLGWYQAGAAALLPSKVGAIVLWSCQWLLSWWIAEILFQAARFGLRGVTLRLWPALVLAAVGNALLASFYAAPYFGLVAEWSGSDARLPTGPGGRNLLDPAYLWMLTQATAPGAILWIGLRATFEHLRPTAPRPGPQDPARASSASIAPPLRATPLLNAASAQGIAPADILAVTAEDHYVRIHAVDRSLLLTWRFADALRDLSALDGVQTHRSAWVRLSAVRALERTGSKRAVRVASGELFPLSERHLALVAAAIDQRALRSEREGVV